MTAVFRRGAFRQAVITLTSLEPLGLLDTAYIEDTRGVDGQVTLTLPGGAEREVLLTGDGPPHERFRGFLDLQTLPNGLFSVAGRARDVAGNWAAFTFPLRITSDLGPVVRVPGVSVAGILPAGAPLPAPGAPAGLPAVASAPALLAARTPAPLPTPEVLWRAAR